MGLGLELRSKEKPIKRKAKEGKGQAKAKEAKEFLTQVFVHGGQHGVDRMRSQRKIAKIFESIGKARIYGVFCACPGVDGETKAGEMEKQSLDTGFTLPHKVNVKSDQWEKAKSLYLAGMDWKAIANDLQLSQATLQTKASREGITKLKREVKQISPRKEISLESLSALVRSKLAQDAASTLERVEGYALEGIKDESVRETILASVAKRSALTFGWSEQGEAASVSINLLGSMPDRNSVEIAVSEPPEK